MEAATRLVAAGRTPSVDEVAEAADVSRRTVYMYFPTLDQLLLDAAVGALSARPVPDAEPAVDESDDVLTRIDALVTRIVRLSPETLPLGRKIIRLTVDAPGPPGTPGQARRGYRRTEWIEQAVAPLRDRLSPERFDRLVSALVLVIDWEAQIVLQDVRRLSPADEERVLRWTARTLVEQAIREEEAT